MNERDRAVVDTRAYVAVVSESLSLAQMTAVIGMPETFGWSIGDSTRRGVPRDHSFYQVDSGCPRSYSAQQHLAALIDPAERIAVAVGRSEGLLRYARLEIVEEFEGDGVEHRTVRLDQRWLRVLHQMSAFWDIDQYINEPVAEADRPDVPDEFMIGQVLRYSLIDLLDSNDLRLNLTDDERHTDQVQELTLRQFFESLPGPTEQRYALDIEQRMVRQPWVETGFALSQQLLTAAAPWLCEVRLRTTIVPEVRPH